MGARDHISRILLLAPLLILFSMFFIYPLGYVTVLSFSSWNGFSAITFAGVKNFLKLFADTVFHISLRNNLIWSLSLGCFQVGLAAIAAFILARKPRFWKTFRTVFFIPRVISAVAIAMLWQAVYNAEFGALNGIITLITGSKSNVNWLGSYNSALPAIIIPQVLYIGYFMIIILASVMNIPESYYEAAKMDGASVLQQELHITIPLSWGTILTAITLAAAYGMRHFEVTYLMTRGGPGHATSILGLMMYKKIGQSRLGEAAAIGVIMVITGFIIITTVRRVLRRETYGE
jgi:raffinose/stachyose/melibiose transport system permease protein